MGEDMPPNTDQYSQEGAGIADHGEPIQRVDIHEQAMPDNETTPQNAVVSSEDGRVEDVSLAWDMAHSAKTERDGAAWARQYAKDIVAAEAAEDGEHKNGWGQRHQQIRLQGEEAARLDKLADKTENWAALLHDHPISDEFKEAHQGVDFDPLSLAKVEADVEQRLDRAKLLEEVLQKTDVNVGYKGLWAGEWVGPHETLMNVLPGDGYSPSRAWGGDLSPYNVVADAYGEEPKPDKPDMSPQEMDIGWVWTQNKEKWQEYHRLSNNPETTLGQLREFYIEAFRVAYIKPTINGANILNSVLEEIRNR